jgi:hypothetical protein
VAQHTPHVEFLVFIADGIPASERHRFGDDAIDATVAIGNRIGAGKFREMAFKYNLTEFCTAIKPFCFEEIFSRSNLGQAVYLDPDILVFSSLDGIFALLESRSIILTPHIVFPSLNEGKRSDSGLLATGLFNLGFLGLSKTSIGQELLQWWGSRLVDQCFVDSHDALFTDQKWMDFVPSLFPAEAVCYLRSLGTNMAPWNFHERRIVIEADGSLAVARRNIAGQTVGDPLVFVHFSGFDYRKLTEGRVAQYNIDGLDIYDDLAPIVESYVREIQTLRDVVLEFLGAPYAFATYSNGKSVLVFHRRLYRAALDAGMTLGDPFATGPGSFFERLQASALLLEDGNTSSFEKANKNNLAGIGRKLSRFNAMMRMVKRLIGFRNYALLLRLMRPYSRPESQLHLLDRRYEQIL